MVQNKAINLIDLYSLPLSCLRPRKCQLDQPFQYFFNSGLVRGLLPFSSDGAGDTVRDEEVGGASAIEIPRVLPPDKRLESNLVQARRIDNGDIVPEGETLVGEPNRVEGPPDWEDPYNLAIHRCSSSRSLIANLAASSRRNFSLFIKA